MSVVDHRTILEDVVHGPIVEMVADRLPKLGWDDWSSLDAIDSQVLSALRLSYRHAEPFPHLVLDGLFDVRLLQEIERSFLQIPPQDWRESDHWLQKKSGTAAGVALPDAARHYFSSLGAAPMCRFLSTVTDVDDLQTDPTLLNGGMHEVPDGGRFELHIDFRHHPETKLTTQLVLITYLNEGWLADFGGALELWHWRPRQHCRSILPIFGRTIIMAVGPRNVHGHPDAVRAPTSTPRRSIAAYYYSKQRFVGDESGAGITGYVDRPNARINRRAVRLLVASLPQIVAHQARRLLRRGRRDIVAG